MLKKIFQLLLCLSLLSSTPLVYSALDDQPITFAISLSLTGEDSALAEPIKRGLLLWQKQVNSNKGILGHPVKLLFADDQSSAQRAVEIYQDYVNNKEIDFLFSPYNSELTEAIAPIAEAAQIPLLATAANSDELWNKGYKYLFGLLQIATDNATAFIEILALSGDHKIAIIGVDDAFARSVIKGANEWADNIAVNVVMEEIFNQKETDFNELASKIVEANTSAIIFVGSLTQTIAMRRALAAKRASNIIFFNASSRTADFFYQSQLGALADKTITPVWWVKEIDHDKPGIVSFKNTYQAMFNESPSYNAALSYAAGEIYQEAITRAKSISAINVRDAIINMDTITVIGRFSVDHTGRQLKQRLFLTQWQNGQLQLVWPKSLASNQIALEK